MEREEADAHREDQAEGAYVAQAEQVGTGLDEEVEVFEESENTQVGRHTDPQEGLSRYGLCRRIQPTTHLEINSRGQENEREESRVPCAVKNVAGHEEQHLAEGMGAYAPIQGKYGGEKNEVYGLSKKHGVYRADLESRYTPCGYTNACVTVCYAPTAPWPSAA